MTNTTHTHTHSNRCAKILHFGFDLCLPGDYECCASLKVYVFGKILFRSSGHFKIRLLVLLLMGYVCACGQSCLTVTPWTPLSMVFSRQEYWSEFTFPTPGDFANPGIEHEFLVSLYHCATWEAQWGMSSLYIFEY